MVEKMVEKIVVLWADDQVVGLLVYYVGRIDGCAACNIGFMEDCAGGCKDRCRKSCSYE